jgi:hypothetical protein
MQRGTGSAGRGSAATVMEAMAAVQTAALWNAR